VREGKELRYDKRDELAKNRHVRFPNPFATLVLLLQPKCGYALLVSGIMYSSFYATMALIPSQFGRIYHFNELQVSLCYIPYGAGALIAAFNRGRMIDSNFRRHAKNLGVATEKNRKMDLSNFPIERARLEVAVPLVFLGSGCMLGMGWTLQYETNLAGPLIFLFVIAFCISAAGNTIAVLMVDLHPGKAGTVTASSNLTRCLLGAGATALVVPMINGIGIGWTVSVFAFLSIAVSPLLWFIMRQGPKWRAADKQKEDEKALARATQ